MNVTMAIIKTSHVSSSSSSFAHHVVDEKAALCKMPRAVSLPEKSGGLCKSVPSEDDDDERQLELLVELLAVCV